MSAPNGPLVGILGGMGPAATVDFYAKLLAATPATGDQEHLRVMIWADPTVPDRSAAIVAGGEDPTPKLIEGARQLQRAGAAFYVVPCNGAHAFLPQVRAAVDLDYVSLIEVTAAQVANLVGGGGAGLIGTDATLASGLYTNALSKVGVQPVVPSQDAQKTVMDSVYAVKAGGVSDRQREKLVDVAHGLVADGADVIVAACTEIPLALTPDVSPRPLIDPAVLLADAAVAEAAKWAKKPQRNLK